MTYIRQWMIIGAILACAAVSAMQATSQSATKPKGKAERARLAFVHALPAMNGERLKVTVVEVTYGPGESSAPHSHPCPVIGYVLEGALRTQVNGEPEATYQAGQSFYEAPNGIHQVSANASQKAPAKFIAYFVCDHETPLSVGVPTTGVE